MYLRPPSAREEARINDWIKVRQSGIRYYLSLGDQRIVDKNYIIRPKAEFEVSHILESLSDFSASICSPTALKADCFKFLMQNGFHLLIFFFKDLNMNHVNFLQA